MGVNGWGPFHELGFVAEHGTMDADLVIITLPLGDLHRPLSRLSAQPYFSSQGPPRLALEELAWHLSWRWRVSRLGGPSEAERAARVERGISAYAELARSLSGLGAEVMIEVLPSRHTATHAQPKPRVKAQLERLTAALAPHKLAHPAALFRAAEAPARLYKDGVHLNAPGHKLYARYLSERVSDHSARWSAFISEEAR